ncbi:MAG: DUF4349 domain-containing protein [Clostridia bacterium]|nr:DUF4349 domain-containing protein [Clostridia bacterium]
MHNINIDENEVLRDALSGLQEDVPPMPEGLHAAWLQKVEEDMEEKRTEKTLNRKALTRFLSVAAALVFVVGGTLLTRDDLAPQADNAAVYTRGAESQYDELADEEAYDYGVAAGGSYTYTASTASGSSNGMVMMARAVPQEPAAPVPEAGVTEKKIIRTARLTIYTQDFEASLENLRALCEADGGWIESSSESTNNRTGLRNATLTLRIPQEALDGYLSGVGQLGRITARSETAEDVTAQYQDTQTRLNTQLALMERLQALITESADLSDLLALESQIADTQYQIDSLTTALNRTDRQVSYSTVTVSLYEETAPALTDTTVSLGERIHSAIRTGCDALADFAQDMLVFLVAALPFIGIVAVVVIVFVIVRKIRRRNA